MRAYLINTRSNSVTAREWELALPSEISDAARIDITRAFAAQLVERYGVAADVAIHAPHREGDQRNHHAHILTTTRVLSAEGLTDKTRVLDAASTGGTDITVRPGVTRVAPSPAGPEPRKRWPAPTLGAGHDSTAPCQKR